MYLKTCHDCYSRFWLNLDQTRQQQYIVDCYMISSQIPCFNHIGLDWFAVIVLHASVIQSKVRKNVVTCVCDLVSLLSLVVGALTSYN